MTERIGTPDHDHSDDGKGGGEINPENANIGNDQHFSPKSRPFTTNEPRTINVPEDVATIQEAVNQIPHKVRHKFIIDVADGDYSDEHVQVPAAQVPNVRDGRSSPNLFLQLKGNATTPGNVKVGSIVTSGNAGIGLAIKGIRTTAGNPEDDEDEGIGSYWDHYLLVVDCEVRNSTSGILSYGSHVHVNGVDFGTDSNKYALRAKKGGRIHTQGGAGGDLTGQVTGRSYNAGGGPIYFHSNNSTLTTSAADGVNETGSYPVLDVSDHRHLTGNHKFEHRLTAESGLQHPNNQASYGTLADGSTHPLMKVSSNDNIILFHPTGEPMVWKTSAGNYGFRTSDDHGFGTGTAKDLTAENGNFTGEIRRHDGTGTPPAGYYEYEAGVGWHGIGRAQGNTI